MKNSHTCYIVNFIIMTLYFFSFLSYRFSNSFAGYKIMVILDKKARYKIVYEYRYNELTFQCLLDECGFWILQSMEKLGPCYGCLQWWSILQWWSMWLSKLQYRELCLEGPHIPLPSILHRQYIQFPTSPSVDYAIAKLPIPC